jgi:hypothetical protein
LHSPSSACPLRMRPNFSALLGIVPPPLAEGRVLNEALK